MLVVSKFEELVAICIFNILFFFLIKDIGKMFLKAARASLYENSCTEPANNQRKIKKGQPIRRRKRYDNRLNK